MTSVNDSALAKELLPIWNQTVRQANGDVARDFLDAAGGLETASKLLVQIKNAGFGEFPPILLYSAPTLDLFAQRIAGSRPTPFSGPIRLKVGAPGKFVFFAHGIDGFVTELAGLAENIQTPHQIFGIQARGSDGCEPPDQTVERMAEFHSREICKIQPSGPCLLVGYSFGGLVMLETARRLIASGRRVSLLTMIDSFPHLKRLPLSERLKVYRRRLANLSEELAQSKTESQANPGANSPATLDVVLRSWERYTPSLYDGNVRFVKAAVTTKFSDNPGLIWGKWIKHLTLESVSGDHRTILTKHVRDLGEVLTRHINESAAEAR
jgi:thioesterase domain-containing protein